MKFHHCEWNPRLICSPLNEKTCPFKAGAFIKAVERWAGASGDLKSMDLSIALGSSLPKARTNAGQENRALKSADIYCLFDDPDAVLAWLQAGSVRRAPIPRGVCDDLKKGFRKWKVGRDEVQIWPYERLRATRTQSY